MVEGTKVELVVNGSTRTGVIVKVQKNGKIVVAAEALYQERTGRRLYAAQRFTVEPSHVVAFSE
jgi:uncharacterized protein (AIM24 family)